MLRTEFCGSSACVVQSRGSDCLADGKRCSSTDSGDHGMGADQWPETSAEC